MKKVLLASLLPFVIMASTALGAGQNSPSNLDNDLIVAASRGDTAEVGQLLQKGANIEAKDKWGVTPLLEAVLQGQIEVVKLLLAKGANVDVVANGKTPLLQAAEDNNMEMVKLLLDNGANTATAGGDEETALVKAVNHGNTEMARLLLEKGSAEQVKGKSGFTALLFAADSGNVEVVRLMLEKGGMDSVNGTVLHSAAENGKLEVVKVLLEKGGNLQSRNAIGYTPLLSAARNGQTAVVNLLLNDGAQIEARDQEGETALHVAARNGHADVAKLLLDRGAQIEAKDNDAFTPLMCAAEAGGIAHAGTPFYVEKFPAVEVINLLLDRGAKIEAKSVDGQTALHRAAFRDRPDAIKALLDRGANIQAMDNQAFTPLSLALESLHGTERHSSDRACESVGCQQSLDLILADKREVVRVLEEALARHPPTTFADYVADLQNHPRDRARRDHVVQLAAALATPPPIPDQARRNYDRASILMKQANDPAELAQPISLLRGVVNFAPWWGDAYHALSQELELAGQYDMALKNLGYFIELNPPEEEASAARSHLTEIQKEKESAISGNP